MPRHDDGSNDTIAVGHDVVAVNLTPLIAGARALKVIGAVVDLLTAVPVVVIHVVAALPFSVLDVLVPLATIIVTVGLVLLVVAVVTFALLLSSVIVVVFVLLGYDGERRAADAEQDACGKSLLEHDVYLSLSDGRMSPCCCSGDTSIP